MSSSSTMLRPWGVFFSPSTLSLPISLSETKDRVSQNLHFFSFNYTLLLLFSLSLSLLPHPLSLLLLLLISALWAFLYFLRDSPLEIMGFPVPDGVLLGFLGVVSFVGLLWAGGWGGLIAGGVLVGAHAVVKAPEEGVEGSPYGDLLADLDGDLEGEGARGEYVRV